MTTHLIGRSDISASVDAAIQKVAPWGRDRLFSSHRREAQPAPLYKGVGVSAPVSGLIVRRKQMHVFERYMLEGFIRRMSARLRDEFPRETAALTPAELRTFIENAITKAETYDVTDEADVERYVEFAARYGPNFDVEQRTAWAGAVLRRDDLLGTEKMNMLDDHELFTSV